MSIWLRGLTRVGSPFSTAVLSLLVRPSNLLQFFFLPDSNLAPIQRSGIHTRGWNPRILWIIHSEVISTIPFLIFTQGQETEIWPRFLCPLLPSHLWVVRVPKQSIIWNVKQNCHSSITGPRMSLPNLVQFSPCILADIRPGVWAP